MIVAGDIGGTHARLAIFELRSGQLVQEQEKVYPSRSAPDLETIVRRFVEEVRPSPTAAALGVAGPVKDGRTETPNLPWVVDGARLAKILSVPRVTLLNDLKANAYGLRHLKAENFAVLHPGAPGAVGNQAVLSAGTGLGAAGLYWDGQRHHPFASEGGHADFAPRSPLQVELREFIARTTGRVSTERVLSGNGLVNTYQFLRHRSGAAEPAWLTERLATQDRGKVISQCGLEESEPVCAAALDLFVTIYGAVAGNLGLWMLASGGVFLGGGIAPKILPKLRDPKLFLPAFLDKGRMRSLLEAMPVRVVLEDRAALWGAAHCAAFDEQ